MGCWQGGVANCKIYNYLVKESVRWLGKVWKIVAVFDMNIHQLLLHRLSALFPARLI